MQVFQNFTIKKKYNFGLFFLEDTIQILILFLPSGDGGQVPHGVSVPSSNNLLGLMGIGTRDGVPP